MAQRAPSLYYALSICAMASPAWTQKGENDEIRKREIQGEPFTVLRIEHMRDMGRDRKPDERCYHDSDVRDHTIADLGAWEHICVYPVRFCCFEDSKGSGCVRIENHEMDLRSDVRLSGMAFHEWDAICVHGYNTRL